MSTVVATLSTKMTLDASDFTKKIDSLGAKLDNLGSRARDLGGTLTTRVTAPIVGIFGVAINAASDLNESVSKTGVVFGNSADEIVAWSKGSANALLMSQNEALGAASNFGNIFTSMGFGADAAADMSMGFVQLGADLASFNNIPTAQSLDAIRAGLLGEYEPLKALGIVLSDAEVKQRAFEMGLVDANGEISAQNMVLARQSLITEKSANASGDAARTAGGFANQMRILRANLINASAAIGQILLPYVTRLIKFVSGLVVRFQGLSNRMKTIIVIVGVVAASIGPLLVAVGFLAPVIGNAIGVGMKLVKFFKILRVTMLSSMWPILAIVAALAALYVIWKYDLFGIQTKIKKWFEVFKAPGGGLDKLKQRFEDLKVAARALAIKALPYVGRAVESIKKTFIRLWDRVKGPLGSFVKLVGDGLVMAIRWAIDNLYRLQPILDHLQTALGALVTMVRAMIDGDWSAAWDAFKTVVESASKAAYEAIKLAWEAIKGVASRIDWGALVSGAADLGAKLIGYTDDLGLLLWGWVQTGATYLAGELGKLWDDHKAEIGKLSRDLVNSIDDVGVALWGWLKAGATWVAMQLAKLWDDHKGKLGELPGKLVDLMIDLGAKLWDWAKAGAKWMAGKITGLWDTHKDSIGQLPGRMISAMGALGSLLWGWAKTGASYLGTQASKIWDNVKPQLAAIPGALISALPGLGDQLYGWVKTGASDAADLVGSTGSAAVSSMRSIGTALGGALKGAFNSALSGIGDWLIGHLNGIIGSINGWINAANSKIPFGNPIPTIPLIGTGGGGGGGGGNVKGVMSTASDVGAKAATGDITINVNGAGDPKSVADHVFAIFSRELGLRGAL